MAYTVRLTGQASQDLKALRTFDQRRITDAIKQQLQHQPTEATKNRKCLEGVEPEFDFEPPLWELRVGEFRIFYDVDHEAQVVHVRAIRRKEQDQTTEDVLHERDDG
jgi:mRNA-degrading endonuclease RelE of RelBE toxin-antitoxin system